MTHLTVAEATASLTDVIQQWLDKKVEEWFCCGYITGTLAESMARAAVLICEVNCMASDYAINNTKV